jgi:hypothetical protein
MIEAASVATRIRPSNVPIMYVVGVPISSGDLNASTQVGANDQVNQAQPTKSKMLPSRLCQVAITRVDPIIKMNGAERYKTRNTGNETIRSVIPVITKSIHAVTAAQRRPIINSHNASAFVITI